MIIPTAKANTKTFNPNPYITNNELIVCGTSGVDFSRDGGLSWTKISDQSFHVLKKLPKSRKILLAGSGGRIASLNLDNH